MSEALLSIQIAIILSLLALLAITAGNLVYLRKLCSYPWPKSWPRVSVLIPARNEENNIRSCISSLLAQDYSDFQVIVLDDNSADRTWEILQELAVTDGRLKLIRGEPLPDDWLGKHWACHQMAQQADGEFFLFADADTVHSHDMLKCAVAAMVGEDAALISALPRQHVKTWSEMLSIPAFYLGLLCGVPMGLTRLQRNPLLFACLGQFLMFTRAAYRESGGYAAVRQNIVDDLAIGRRIHAMGLHYKLLNGNGQVSCRMYSGFEEVWRGLTKSTFATFNFNPPFIVFLYLLILALFVMPLVVLAVGLAQPGLPLQVTAAAGVAVFLALVLWIISNERFHFPLYLVVIYPLSAIFMSVIALASMVLTMQGKALWKGRTMPRTARL